MRYTKEGIIVDGIVVDIIVGLLGILQYKCSIFLNTLQQRKIRKMKLIKIVYHVISEKK